MGFLLTEINFRCILIVLNYFQGLTFDEIGFPGFSKVEIFLFGLFKSVQLSFPSVKWILKTFIIDDIIFTDSPQLDNFLKEFQLEKLISESCVIIWNRFLWLSNPWKWFFFDVQDKRLLDLELATIKIVLMDFSPLNSITWLFHCSS